ncbi:TetR/AcrR family transcriptional regulator [Marinomonas balearica]|uniref:TetR family transcriptional regulator n=1 Tax=Marinomonas balearica TaxID=491947 RepID=A0A4R6M8R6_9GAMM|nr:TetR/AcrR family transcriptional regulator [Marinomonas balearica]TDO97365.1 TetR family transcriptional regulator [Marinomonas balearica]
MDMQATIESATTAVNPTKVAIMDAAEKAILKNGYKAMSFRDLAAEVGIKSASVHYHFPTKANLVTAVMQRYKEEFAKRLILPKKKKSAAQKALNKFIDGFKETVVDQDNLSLCTVLSAEKNLLEPATIEELNEFYQLKLDWLGTVVSYMRKDWMTTEEVHNYASRILASLHGASVLVKATGNPDMFNQATVHWRDLIKHLDS